MLQQTQLMSFLFAVDAARPRFVLLFLLRGEVPPLCPGVTVAQPVVGAEELDRKLCSARWADFFHDGCVDEPVGPPSHHIVANLWGGRSSTMDCEQR